jgi:hypothetical protein
VEMQKDIKNLFLIAKNDLFIRKILFDESSGKVSAGKK